MDRCHLGVAAEDAHPREARLEVLDRRQRHTLRPRGAARQPSSRSLPPASASRAPAAPAGKSATFSDQLPKSDRAGASVASPRRARRSGCCVTSPLCSPPVRRGYASTGVMKATSKSDEDIWYGLRLPARRCAASLSAGGKRPRRLHGKMRSVRRRRILHLLLRRRDDVARIVDADDSRSSRACSCPSCRPRSR